MCLARKNQQPVSRIIINIILLLRNFRKVKTMSIGLIKILRYLFQRIINMWKIDMLKPYEGYLNTY